MRLKLKSWPWDLISRVSTGSTIYILTKDIQYCGGDGGCNKSGRQYVNSSPVCYMKNPRTLLIV